MKLIADFLRFPLFGFYSGEKKITDKHFWSVLVLVG